MRELAFLHRDVKGSTAYLEAALDRIARFSTWAGTNPGQNVADVWRLFAERSPALGLWILRAEEGVVGHVWIEMRPWDGKHTGWVKQLHMDLGHQALGEAEISQAITAIDQWMRAWNLLADHAGRKDLLADDFLMVTPRETHAWGRAFGFFKHRDLYRRTLPTR